MRALAVLVAALFLGGPAVAQTVASPQWDVASLMQRLQQVKASQGRFTERKYLAMLSQPLQTSGTLSYTAPDRLEKVTLTPSRERFALDGDTLTVERDTEKRVLPLRQYPEIGAFVESIRATLAGDLPALSRFYALQLEGTPDDWRLILRPSDPKMRDMVNFIRISGGGTVIRGVDTQEVDGDRSEMTIVAEPK